MTNLDLRGRWAGLKRPRQTATVPSAALDAALAAMGSLPEAAAHLQAVEEMVEQCATRIMDECDQLGVLAGDARAVMEMLQLPPDADASADALAALDGTLDEMLCCVRRIYEVCHFQDLGHQRNQKVVTLLEQMQAKLAPLQRGADRNAGAADEEPLTQDEVDAVVIGQD